MAIVVPGVAKNYQSQTVAIASKFAQEPTEGRYQIPFEIDWTVMGGPNNVVSINLQTSGGTKQITQMQAVHVDNSNCGSDVQFIFTDTSETITIPGFTPYYLVPIFSRSLSFYVATGLDAQVVTSGDVTRFSIFNFVPPPVIGQVSDQSQNTAVVGAINAAVPANFQIIPVGISGTLEALQVFGSIQGASSTKQGTWQIVDGNGVVIAGGTNNANGDETNYNAIILDLSSVKIPFQKGLAFDITATTIPVGSIFTVNAYYRLP